MLAFVAGQHAERDIVVTNLSVSLSVCLSVCLYVYPSHSVIVPKRIHISSIFPPSGSGMTLVLSAIAVTKFLDELLQRGSLNMVTRICDFRQKLPFISETVRDRRILTMEH